MVQDAEKAQGDKKINLLEAGDERIELPTSVLETEVIPLN